MTGMHHLFLLFLGTNICLYVLFGDGKYLNSTLSFKKNCQRPVVTHRTFLSLALVRHSFRVTCLCWSSQNIFLLLTLECSVVILILPPSLSILTSWFVSSTSIRSPSVTLWLLTTYSTFSDCKHS